jgi:hypothetical protein
VFLSSRQDLPISLPVKSLFPQGEFRELWNHGDSTPDVLEAGVFLEMPLDLVVRPRQWGDLIPFAE